MHVDIEEAVPETDKYARPYDVFPGTKAVTNFEKFVFWNGDSMEIALSEITESEDKEYITFIVDMSVSSSETVSSSSTKEISSSSEDVVSSSSEVILSSSSKGILSSSSIKDTSSSSIENIASSSDRESSSSFEISSSETYSSSSEASTAITYNNGLLELPIHGPKVIRIFSLHGKLLYETIVYEKGYQFVVPRPFRNSKTIITVSQNGKILFTRESTYKSVTLP
jgi:hypothetical protein